MECIASTDNIVLNNYFNNVVAYVIQPCEESVYLLPTIKYYQEYIIEKRVSNFHVWY